MATQTEALAFIQTIAPIIQRYSAEYGYHVSSPIIAQACIESAYGQSGLAKYHNYFGLKCGSSWKGASVNMKTKEEYTVGTLTDIRANFRAYTNMDEGVKGYFDFISTKRYANLKTATSPTEYLTMIKTDGYATSSSYVNTNMKVVEKYNLTTYDAETTPTGNSYQVGSVYTTLSDLYIREAPRGNYKELSELTVDGQRHSFADIKGAVLKKRTRVTIKEVQTLEDGAVWVRIPSGWLCARGASGKTYIA